jgi:hypothetical protein
MTLTDHNALIGPYPFRRLPEPTPERLLAEMDRLGITAAWVGHVRRPRAAPRAAAPRAGGEPGVSGMGA